jgi:hypothetical protein
MVQPDLQELVNDFVTESRERWASEESNQLSLENPGEGAALFTSGPEANVEAVARGLLQFTRVKLTRTLRGGGNR